MNMLQSQLLKIPIPHIEDMRAPFTVISGICASADNDRKIIDIAISPKLCIAPNDAFLPRAAKRPTSLTRFICYYPQPDRRRAFTARYTPVERGCCVTVHGVLRRATRNLEDDLPTPFEMEIYSMSVASVTIPLGLELVWTRRIFPKIFILMVRLLSSNPLVMKTHEITQYHKL